MFERNYDMFRLKLLILFSLVIHISFLLFLFLLFPSPLWNSGSLGPWPDQVPSEWGENSLGSICYPDLSFWYLLLVGFPVVQKLPRKIEPLPTIFQNVPKSSYFDRLQVDLNRLPPNRLQVHQSLYLYLPNKNTSFSVTKSLDLK